MLQKLVVRNYAIIDHLIFEPDKNLNIITGETGAGKSIILGALSLILGERADSTVLINKEEKCVVEGYFDMSNLQGMQPVFLENELDFENPCIIRREISVSGKSRAFINDTPVTLHILTKIVSKLVDLHRQFGHEVLQDEEFPLTIMDALGDNHSLLAGYSESYSHYRKLIVQLNDLKEKRALWQKESDYKQHLYDELTLASFRTSEIEEAEQQMKQVANSEKIKGILMAACSGLETGEKPVLAELKHISKQFAGIVDLMPGLHPFIDRLNSTFEELKDLEAELESINEKLSFDPELLETLQQRIDTGYKLLKKHSVNSTAELIEIHHKLGEELKATLNLNEAIEKLAQEETLVYRELLQQAELIAARRAASAPVFTEKMNELLSAVGMPNARFKVQISRTEPAATGIDEIHFLFDANKSGVFQHLEKTASGGEMSRIMLCIKSLTAQALNTPSLVFDEVDAGISGEAARQVANLLRDISRYRQVICITHQPQVAAKGSRHFYVYKQADNSGKYITKIRVLTAEDRVLSIAGMIGGENPSKAAIKNARELVEG